MTLPHSHATSHHVLQGTFQWKVCQKYVFAHDADRFCPVKATQSRIWIRLNILPKQELMQNKNIQFDICNRSQHRK